MATGDPIQPDLASVTVAAISLPKSPSTTWTTFTFDTPYALSSNVDYAIIVRMTNDILIGDKLEWGQDTAAGFAGGQGYLSSDADSSWAAVPTRDRAFIVNDFNGDRDEYLTVNAWQAAYHPFYIGQTFNSAAQAYTAISVDLPLRRTTNTPPGTITISLRDTAIAAPGKPINPVPGNSATGVSTNQATLSWDTGGNTDTYNVYFDDGSGMTLVSTAQVGTSFSLSSYLPFDYGTAYSWRVDAANAQHTTTGDTWSFTTLSLSPPVPTGSNTMITIKRLCACANGKFWYENV